MINAFNKFRNSSRFDNWKTDTFEACGILTLKFLLIHFALFWLWIFTDHVLIVWIAQAWVLWKFRKPPSEFRNVVIPKSFSK